MNTFNKHYIDIEHHALELTLSHIRIVSPLTLKKMVASIDAHGQLSPVIVVPSGTPNRFTLMDGYVRIQAMKKLRQDIVKAENWKCSEAEALLSLFVHQGQRNWEIFEEAQALRELQTRYQMSQEQISTRIGRTKSWVSRRLALLDVLSDELIHDVVNGQISVWAASRILTPLARANTAHSDLLIKYLRQNQAAHSTRELSDFFKHYQKSNQAAREKMVMQPDLFFKAQKALTAERQAKLLKAGPEGQWRWRLANMKDQIKQIEKLVPQLFYERQDPKISQHLREPLERIQRDLNEVLIQSRRLTNDRQDEASNHHYITPIRQELPAH